MNEKDFCNWLAGYLEVAQPEVIGKEEIAMIAEHLELARNNSRTAPWGDPPYYVGSLRFGITDKVRAAHC